MAIYKVYKITNRLNGKIYVGQTKHPVEKRFMQHLHANSPLGQAMRQCGAENFTIEVIEECETQAQLNERERFWIKVFQTAIIYQMVAAGLIMLPKTLLNVMNKPTI